MESKDIVIGGGTIMIHLLNKLVFLGEDMGKQHVSSFSWLLLYASDRKEMSSKRIGPFGSREKR